MYYCANVENMDDYIRNGNRYILFKSNLLNCDILCILEKYNIDSVIHFVAQSHVQNSFNESLQYTKDNIMGTHELLEACRIYGKIEKFIHVSTDEVYGESMIKDARLKKRRKVFYVLQILMRQQKHAQNL